MPKNDGKSSEKFFEDMIQSRGKSVYLYRFVDANDILRTVRAKTGKRPAGVATSVPGNPADYLVVDDGRTYFAEVKSSKGKVSFPFGNIEAAQWTAAKRTLAAGGDYVFFIHNKNTDRWYRVPERVILDHPKQSIKWTEIESYEIWKR